MAELLAKSPPTSKNAMADTRGRAAGAVMVRAVSIQIFVLVSYLLVNLALHRWALAFAPLRNVLLSGGLHALFMLYWLWVLRFAGQPRQRWILLDPRSTGSANLPMIATIFLVLPYADDAMRLAVGIFALGATAVLMVGSIRRPPAPGIGPLSPLGMPVAMVVFNLASPGRYAIEVGVFFAAAIVALLAARTLVQTIVNNAHAANLKAEAALAEARSEREARTRFLESASHDLGQPLQAARLFFETAMRGRTESQRHAAAAKVEWALDSTQNQLAQMLEHLRLEAGAITPHLGSLALGPILAQLAGLHAPAASAAGVRIIVRKTGLIAFADPMLVERAVSNLIGNAVRHARARTIRIVAFPLPPPSHQQMLRLWVLDDGVGIASADAAKLFDDYFQGSDHGDSIRGGFGLGLASVRRIAVLLGASAGHKPRKRCGSGFWIDLPQQQRLADAAQVDTLAPDAKLPHLR
jgi:signal transduction histidine kinase